MAKRAPKGSMNINWSVLKAMGIVCLVIVQILEFVFLMEVANNSANLQTYTFQNVLIDSIRGLNTEPAQDIATGKFYIPASRLVLPATSTNVYYRSASTDAIALLDRTTQDQAITAIRNTHETADIYKGVGAAQACSRQVVGVFKGEPSDYFGSDNYSAQPSKTLKDGRILRLYVDNECPLPAATLLNAINEMNSY